jgi:hypothetical protein
LPLPSPRRVEKGNHDVNQERQAEAQTDDQETGATRGFERITIQSVDPKTGATRGPDIEMVPVKKAAGGRLGYRSARQPK